MGALNTIGVVITIALAVVGLGLVGLMAVTSIGKVKQDTDDLLRIKRETQEASWAIHQRASAAFTAMLAEARSGGGGTDSSDKSNKSDLD